MWTSVLNFHTLLAMGNSIREAENPVTSGILPAATGLSPYMPSSGTNVCKSKADVSVTHKCCFNSILLTVITLK